MRRLLATVLGLIGLASGTAAFAANPGAEDKDLDSEIPRYHLAYVINADGSYTETYDTAVRPLRE